MQLYHSNIRDLCPSVTSEEFDRHNYRVLKALRDCADPDHAGAHKTSPFMDIRIKIDERTNRYNRVARTEMLGCLFQGLALQCEAPSFVPDTLDKRCNLLPITHFDMPDDESLKQHLHYVFGLNVGRFDFAVKYAGDMPAEQHPSTTTLGLMATARDVTIDKIVKVEEMRTQLEAHLIEYKDKFERLKHGGLDTTADSGDERDSSSGEEDDEEYGEEEDAKGVPKPKRRKLIEEIGTGTDTPQQRIDLSSIETARGGGITSLRTRDFKGDVPTHAVELLATLACPDAFRGKLPEPKVPEFTSGAETNGVTLVEPSMAVEGDTSMTQKLIDSGLRDAYEEMLRLRKDLRDAIRAVSTHVLSNFELVINLMTADGDFICRKSPTSLSAAEKYAIGMLYMHNISTPRPVEDAEEDEEEDGEEEEGEEESDDEESWEGSGEESSEDESDDDSDEEYSDEESSGED